MKSRALLLLLAFPIPVIASLSLWIPLDFDGTLSTEHRGSKPQSGGCPSGFTCTSNGDTNICDIDDNAGTWTITAASGGDEEGRCIAYKTAGSEQDIHVEFQLSSTITGDQGAYAGCGAFLSEGTGIGDYTAYTWFPPTTGTARLKTDAGGAGELGQLGEFGTSLPRYFAVQYDTSDTDIRGAEGDDGSTWGQVGDDVSKTLSFPVVYGIACFGYNSTASTTYTITNVASGSSLEALGGGGGGPPTLAFEEDFDSSTWYNGNGWGGGTDPDASPRFGCQSAGEIFTRETSGANGVTLIDGPAGRFRIVSGKNCGGNASIFMEEVFGDLPGFGESVYFRYYVAFSDNWDHVQNSKFPGWSGPGGGCGFGGCPVDGTNGWSARGKVAEPCADPSTIGMDSYVYHADMPGTYGATFDWNTAGCGESRAADQGTWYCIEQRITMNTGPGSNRDGKLHVWIDGFQVLDRNDVLWDINGDFPIYRVWFNWYHGGGQVAPQNLDAYVDHIAISQSPIGCDL